MRRFLLLASASLTAAGLAACQPEQQPSERVEAEVEDQQRGQGATRAEAEPAETVSETVEKDGVSFEGLFYEPVARASFAFAESLPDAKGAARFYWDDRRLMMHVRAEGLTPGQHGIHLHDIGDCSAEDFSSAGDHIDPENDNAHGLDHPDGPEEGDLRNLLVDSDGVADQNFGTRLLLQGEAGARPKLLDADGSAIVIHENRDDQSTQPGGGSGARIACAVIEGIEGAPTVTGRPVEVD